MAPADRDLPDLRALRALVIVSEAGSLARGAVLANVPQSTISRQLASLEQQVGGRLFHRTGRGVELTELGERYLIEARAVLSQVEQLVQATSEFSGRAYSKVAIGILTSLINPFIPRVYAEAAKRYPNIVLRVLEGSSAQLEDWLSSGRVDMCIVHGPGRKVGGTSVGLGHLSLHLVGGADAPLAASPTIKFQQLAGVPLILSGPESGLRSILDRYAHQRHIPLKIALEADSLAVQKSVARLPGVYTILADVAVAREVASGQLRAARIVDPSIRRPIVLAATSHHPMSAAARQIYRLMHDLATSSPITSCADPEAE